MTRVDFRDKSITAAIYIVVVTVIFWVGLGTISAQNRAESKGVRVSPLRSRPVIEPGKSLSGVIKLKNQDKQAVRVELQVQRFSVVNENYDYTFSDDSTTQWISFPKSEVDIASGASVNVPYALSVPNGASPGGYYYAIFAVSESSGTQGSVRELQRVASLIYLEVSGDVNRKGVINEISLPSVTFSRTVPLRARISNQGNVHFDADLQTKIKNQTVLRLNGLLLPGTTRLLQGEFETPFLPGVYKVTSSFDVDGKQVSSEKTLIYAPPWFMISAFVMSGLGLSYILKRRKH